MSEATLEQSRHEFLVRVNRASAAFGYGIKSIVEFGPGLIGLEDSSGALDVYFDIRVWGINNQKNTTFWGDISPRGIGAYFIGILRGVGSRPAPKTQAELLVFVRSNLASIRSDIKLHALPLAIFPPKDVTHAAS